MFRAHGAGLESVRRQFEIRRGIKTDRPPILRGISQPPFLRGISRFAGGIPPADGAQPRAAGGSTGTNSFPRMVYSAPRQ